MEALTETELNAAAAEANLDRLQDNAERRRRRVEVLQQAIELLRAAPRGDHDVATQMGSNGLTQDISRESPIFCANHTILAKPA